MLSELLEAGAPTVRNSRPGRTGLSMSSLFPCAYRLRLVHDGKYWGKNITPQQFYNMDDGWWQEEQSVKRLAQFAKIRIIDRQNRVTIGKSMVPGSYDGAFVLDSVKYLWEHKAYDKYSEAVQFMEMWGMDRLPGQKAQTNGYMLGAGLEWADFFVKVKNDNTYKDIPYQIDKPFIEEIVEWCDKIRLEDWKPEPTKCKWCPSCGVNCFGETLDFSWIQTAEETEIVDKWKKGKQFVNIGSMLMEEADAALIGIKDKEGNITVPGLIGDKDLLVMPGLEIKRVAYPSRAVDKALVLQEFGPEGFIKVSRERFTVQYRHKEV
jgi:hypothetical protein